MHTTMPVISKYINTLYIYTYTYIIYIDKYLKKNKDKHVHNHITSSNTCYRFHTVTSIQYPLELSHPHPLEKKHRKFKFEPFCRRPHLSPETHLHDQLPCDLEDSGAL